MFHYNYTTLSSEAFDNVLISECKKNLHTFSKYLESGSHKSLSESTVLSENQLTHGQCICSHIYSGNGSTVKHIGAVW